MKRWIRRLALAPVALLGLATAVGSACELLARRRAARDFPPPGALIDLGGRRIQLDCRGAGSPVVVFEAGLDLGGALSWSAVHDSIARITRACAYSRAGIMWSDPTTLPPTAAAVAEDLHATLIRAGERPPFVLVGHSLGGPYIMAYTQRFGADVAGLVFVDATHPDQARRLGALHAGRSRTPTLHRIAAALSWTGIVRAAFPAALIPTNEPPEAARAMLAYAPTSLSRVLEETDAFDAILREAGAFRQLGDRPVFVLTASPTLDAEDLAALGITAERHRQIVDARKALHDDVASWSSRSRHEVVTGSDHCIQFDKPDAVVDAVRWVVESVRGAGL